MDVRSGGPAAQGGPRRGVPAWLASSIAGAVAVGVCTWMAWQAGGWFPDAHLTAASIVFAALAVTLALYRPHYALSTHALVAFAALAALAAWTGLSGAWSLAPDGATEAFQRALLHAGLFGLGLVAVGSGRYARHVVWAVLAAVAVVCGAGLATRLLPDVATAAAAPPIAGSRLQHPLGYWNAFGAVAATGTVLALGLAADARGRVVARAGAAALAVVLFTAMYLSLSRGAWLALFAALVVLVALFGHRGSLLLVGAATGVPAVLAVLRLRGYPEIVNGPADAGAGHAFAVQLALFAGLAALLVALLAAGRTSVAVMDGIRRAGRPLAAGLAVVVVVVAAGAYLTRADDVEGRSAGRLDEAAAWISSEWREFTRPATFSETGTARLTTARGTRSDLYRVAFDVFGEHPLRGAGAASYEVLWMRERRVDEVVTNAHSLELETLAELGLVGFAALLLFLGTLVWAVVRSRLRPGALRRDQAAAVGAACTVWVAHSAVDWDWQVSAYTGLVLVLAASLYPYGRRRVRRRTARVAP